MKKAMLCIIVAVSTLSLKSQTVYVPNGASGIGTSSNGNVGVGTSSPAGKFHVYGGDTYLWGLNLGFGTNIARITTDASKPLSFQIAGNEYIRLSSSGNVGIGVTPADEFRLKLKGIAAIGQWVNGTATIDAYNGLAFYGCNTPTNGIAINSAGSIGIGTAAPLAKLHINSGANNSYASILATSDEGNNLVVSSLSTQPAYTKVFTLCHEYFNSSSCRNNGAINFYRGGSERGGFLTFDTDGQERLRIDEWGKLGIGTTTPDQKLTVNGKIHAQEIIVDLNVPAADYVFSKDYSLMPLHQVETFVKENSHLPEIPSASEVKEKGLSVGEMQNKLLQKIEELTLYVIEQDKRIRALESENKELKK